MPFTWILTKKTTIYFLGVCVSFFLNVQPFFLWFCGIELALINKMNCREIFVSLCLQFMICRNLERKILFDAGFLPWKTRYVTIYCQYYHGSKIKQETKSCATNWNIKVWAIHFKLLRSPISVCLDSNEFHSSWILYLPKLNLQNRCSF